MKEQTNYYEIIGITTAGEIIMLDYIFKHSDGFKGATGSVFVPVSQEEIEERNDIENVIDSYGYLWQEAVESGLTTLSQEDYMQEIIDSSDGYYLGHDTSYIYKIPESFKNEYYPDAETFECIGGGRCFSRNMEWEILLRPDLLKLIEEVEE